LLHLGKKLLILEIFKVYNVLFLLPSYWKTLNHFPVQYRNSYIKSWA
jgi:hypothetical protein